MNTNIKEDFQIWVIVPLPQSNFVKFIAGLFNSDMIISFLDFHYLGKYHFGLIEMQTVEIFVKGGISH